MRRGELLTRTPWFQRRRADLARIDVIRRHSNLQLGAGVFAPRDPVRPASDHLFCAYLCTPDMVSSRDVHKICLERGRKTVLIHS